MIRKPSFRTGAVAMRQAFIIVPLLLSVSAALAEPPPQQTSIAAAEPARHHKLRPTHQLTPTSYPAYHRDAATDGNCYVVFGDLHCDRIAKTAHK